MFLCRDSSGSKMQEESHLWSGEGTTVFLKQKDTETRILCLCEECRSLAWEQVAHVFLLQHKSIVGTAEWGEGKYFSWSSHVQFALEPCHEIYSACSWLSGRKLAVFHDILIALFKIMCLTLSFQQVLGYWQWECIPYFQYTDSLVFSVRQSWSWFHVYLFLVIWM